MPPQAVHISRPSSDPVSFMLMTGSLFHASVSRSTDPYGSVLCVRKDGHPVVSVQRLTFSADKKPALRDEYSELSLTNDTSDYQNASIRAFEHRDDCEVRSWRYRPGCE